MPDQQSARIEIRGDGTPATRAFVKAIRDASYPYGQVMRSVSRTMLLASIAEKEAARALGLLPPQPPIEWVEQLCAISQERADQRRQAARDRQARRLDIAAAILWFVAVLAVGILAGH